jgi:2-C-methyl-D-erythritol 4-phosphate cytidylyltransferase
MLNGQKIGGLLLMGGSGKRFGSQTPKQFHRLSGKPIYLVTLEAFLETGFFDEIVLSCHPDWVESVQAELNPSWPITITASGQTRQESSYLGLRAFKHKPDVVLIHDAVRPFVSSEILEENARLAIAHGAVDTCIPSTDTLVYSDDQTTIDSIPDRSKFLRGQTPQSFSYTLILEAHEKSTKSDVSDDCRLVLDQGHAIWLAKGNEHNLKITSELDLFLAEQIFRFRRAKPIKSINSIATKTYAVVGGFGGIGQEICTQIELLGGVAIPLSRRTGLDLTKPSSIVETFQQIGDLDGLINCAGLLKINPLTHLTHADIDQILSVNLSGLIFSCKAANFKTGAHLINIASSSYARGRKDQSIYSCSKAAVVNFTQALAEERLDLRIHAVIPQRTKTPMRLEQFPNENVDQLLDPKQVADAVIALLQDSVSTGTFIEVKQT